MEEGRENGGGGGGCGASARSVGAGYGAVFGAVCYTLRCGPGGDRASAGGVEGSRRKDAKGGRMKGRVAEPLRVAAYALAGLMLAGSIAARNPQTAKLPENKNPPTVASAQKFLEEVESRYFDLTNKAQRAS